MRFLKGFSILSILLIAACTGRPDRPTEKNHGSDDLVEEKVGEPIKKPVVPGEVSKPIPSEEIARLPFEALPPDSSLTKVKTLLTGKVPTDAEFKAYRSNQEALKEIVSKWVASPEYYKIMERFFADAFQQSQVNRLDFGGNFGDGQTFPDERLVRNYRQSFAKTVTEIIKNDRSFQEVATTKQFMMTSAMMVDYAFHDTSGRADIGANGRMKTEDKIDRLTEKNPNWSFRITEAPVSLKDTMDPASPNFLKFSVPSLNDYFAGPNRNCGNVDTITINGQNAGTNAQRLSNWLYRFMTGDRFVYKTGSAEDESACRSIVEVAPKLLSNSDYNDWRLVTIKPASAQRWSKFYDYPALRKADELHLYSPRVGYFTTQAFFAQFNTNFSNQARGITNQTMIVGLGESFNGGNGDFKFRAAGQDLDHASQPECFACHNNLDPMKQFFRVNYSLNFSEQRKEDVKSITPTFLFKGVQRSGSTMDLLGESIAQHPDFAIAWTQKLCSYANSSDCRRDDAELVRIAKVFADSGFKWNTLAVELFSSPIITLSSRTDTGVLLKNSAPIARRAQLCAILDSRLGKTNLCGLGQIQTDTDDETIPSVAMQLPADQYSRGAEAPSLVADSDPFYLSAIEKICALVADKVVNTEDQTLPLQSTMPKVAIQNIVSGLMAVPGDKSSKPIEILSAHFEAAKAGGSSPEEALKSVFVLGCMSPAVSSITQ